jgi:hypothetical protein
MTRARDLRGPLIVATAVVEHLRREMMPDSKRHARRALQRVGEFGSRRVLGVHFVSARCWSKTRPFSTLCDCTV